MILVLTLTALALFVYQIHFKKTGFYPLLTLYIPILLYLLFIIEVYYTPIEYFISDEIGYWGSEFNDLNITMYDRIAWYSLNYFFKNIDIGGVIAIKLINIPILFFTLYMMWSQFFKDKRVFLVILVLPYLGFLATKNLRDIFVLFLIVSSVWLLHKSRFGKIVFLFPLIILFFTRPFLGVISVLVITIEPVFRKYFKFSILKARFIINKKIVVYILAASVAFFVVLSIPYVNKRINSYLLYLNYYSIGEGYQYKIEERGGIATNNVLLDYAIGAVRYIFTPIPTSMAQRMLTGGSEQWGIMDDVIRTLNQLFYYFLLFYAIYNSRSILVNLKYLNAGARQLLLLLFAYLPLYTFFGFGVAHQRNKLPFQIAIFLLFIVNTYLNQKKIQDEL